MSSFGRPVCCACCLFLRASGALSARILSRMYCWYCASSCLMGAVFRLGLVDRVDEQHSDCISVVWFVDVVAVAEFLARGGVGSR